MPEFPEPSADWEGRTAAAWADFAAATEPLTDPDPALDAAFRARIDALAAELPPGHPAAAFERAAIRDSTGDEAGAEAHYREALDGTLPGERRRRAVIQLASTLRNLGRRDEAIALLTAERERTSDHLDDALAAVLALCLASAGRGREGVAVAVAALAPHLPRYRRSMAAYAEALVEDGS